MAFKIQYYIGVIILLLGFLWAGILLNKTAKYKIPKEHRDNKSFRISLIIMIIGIIVILLSAGSYDLT